MNKIELQKMRDDYKKIWQNLKLDYDKTVFPVVQVCYADVLARPLFYPMNKIAYALTLLTRRKTFTKAEIEHIKAIGFPVDIQVRQIQAPDDM